jgi:hypothetical protein
MQKVHLWRRIEMGFRKMSLILTLVLICFLAVGAFATPTIPAFTVSGATTGGFYKNSIDVNFSFVAVNVPVHTWVSGDINFFNPASTMVYGVTDTNLLDGAGNMVCPVTDLNSGTCGLVINTQVIGDNNYTVRLTVKDNDGGSIDSNIASVIIDSNAPTLVYIDGNSTTWRNADFNVAIHDVNFIYSGKSIAKYQLSRYITAGTDWNGAWTDFSRTVASDANSTYYTTITTALGDGNYVLMYWLRDNAGNDTNGIVRSILLDTNAPNITTALTIGKDYFYGTNQDINFRVTMATTSFGYADTNTAVTSGLNTLKVICYDMNDTDQNKTITAHADGNYTINTGTINRDFNAVYLRMILTDNATNSRTVTMTNPVILYDMNYPAGTSQDAHTTNFQDITDFADINFLTFQDVLNRGRILYFNQDINLADTTGAAGRKLLALSTSLTMGSDAAGNKYLDLNSAAFNDINHPAQVTIYNLPYATTPPIKMDDANCTSTNCFGITYAGGRLDFNVLHFSRYTADNNAPDFNVTYTTTTTSVTPIITSDEYVTCKYGTTLVGYDSMTDGTQIVPASVATSMPVRTGYSAYNAGTLYVQCRDPVGHDTNATISFRTNAENNLTGATGGSSTTTTTSTVPTETTGTSTTTTVSESTQEYTPTVADVESVLSAATNNDGTPLYTAEQVAAIAQTSTDYSFTKAVKVEEIKTTNSTTGVISTSYKTTFTISVKNNNTTDMSNVLVVETISKAVAATITAAQVSSALEFKVLAADPVIQFTVPMVKAGQTASVSYALSTSTKPDTTAKFASPAVAGETVVTASTNTGTGTGTNNTGTGTNNTNTTSTGTGTQNTSAPAAPMDYTLLIVIIVIVVIVIVGYVMVSKKKQVKFGK